MKKLLCALLFAVLPCLSIAAEEEDPLAPGHKFERSAITEPAAVEEKEWERLPACNDEIVVKSVLQKIDEYNAEHPVTSILEKRNRLLRKRFLRAYDEQPLDSVSSKNNRDVANKILMLKINEHLTDNKIKLCRSTFNIARFEPVFLIIYKELYGPKTIEIMNITDNPQESLKVQLM